MLLCDRAGILYPGGAANNPEQEELALVTNQAGRQGSLADALQDADVFIGVSAGNIVDRTMVARMAPNAIVFAMANPVPEILPEEALAGGVRVMGTGRSDFPNQINNVLAFPGIFRGALDVRAKDVNEAMKLAAAHAIAGVIAEDELTDKYIIPDPFDPRVAQAVAKAVAQAARDSGIAQI